MTDYTADWIIENPISEKVIQLNGVFARILPIIGDTAIFTFGDDSDMCVEVDGRLIAANFTATADASISGLITAARHDGIVTEVSDELDAALDALSAEWVTAHPELADDSL